MKSFSKRSIKLISLSIFFLMTGCTSPKFNIGECLIPKSENSPQKIVKVLAVGKEEYKTFTHFFSNGKLIQAQDYQATERSKVENNYMKVECPKIDDSFSPDRYLDEKHL